MSLYCEICYEVLNDDEIELYCKYMGNSMETKININDVYQTNIPIMCVKHWCICMPNEPPYHWCSKCSMCDTVVCCMCKYGTIENTYCNDCWDKLENCSECNRILFYDDAHDNGCSKRNI